MAVKSLLARKVLGLLGSFGLRVLRSTIDWRAIYADVTVDPVNSRYATRAVYACWHENMLVPLAMRAHRNNLGLASQHSDADIITRAIRHLGWSVVRGSTTRGSVLALLKMLRDDKRNLSITPDGPRGPRRTMSTGPIFLASKLGVPLTCIGCGYDRPWRMGSWDRFAIPRPFSRARVVFGPPLAVPAKLDRDALEGHRLWFEGLLNWLTEEAEAWAESGRRRRGELPMAAGKLVPEVMQWNPADALCLPDWLQNGWIRLGNRPAPAGCRLDSKDAGRAA